jgi:hypothetical protein
MLNSFKAKIVELGRPAETENVVHGLLDRITESITGLSKELPDLRSTVGKTPSRGDVMRIVRGLLTNEDDDQQTAIGSVHCIAWGREMKQVAGALTEEDAMRVLGEPLASVATFAALTGPIAHMFVGPASFDRVDRRARLSRRDDHGLRKHALFMNKGTASVKGTDPGRSAFVQSQKWVRIVPFV